MRGRKKRTTRHDPCATPAPDLVKGNFCATASHVRQLLYVAEQVVVVVLSVGAHACQVGDAHLLSNGWLQ
jgi:hypothetical protein